MKPLIEVDGLTYRYPDANRDALSQVSFCVDQGEWIAIVGRNGSGKSTLARSLNGLIPFETGSVTVDGIKLNDETVWDVRQRIGMIFQNPDNQFVGATVEDDVAFGLENLAIDRATMQTRVLEAVRQVGMTDFLGREPSRLSGGQKQRVALAGMIAVQPKILILDEATSMLDPKGRTDVIQLIKTLRQTKQLTIISITHDVDEAADADRVIVMDNGQLIETTTPRQLFADQQALTLHGLAVPFAESLRKQLQQLGVAVPNEYQTESELVNWLWQSRLKK